MQANWIADAWNQLLVGGALPLLIALLNQTHWPRALKAVVALVTCLVVTTLAVWLSTPLHAADWRAVFVRVAGAALISYSVLWKPSTIAPQLEAGTTPGVPAATAGR